VCVCVSVQGLQSSDTPNFPILHRLSWSPSQQCQHVALTQIQLCSNRIFACPSKGSPYSITERRVPELIPVLGSQPAGDISHKPSGRLPLLSARPAVTLAILKRTATNFAAW